MALDGLWDFLKMIGDFLMSTIEGLVSVFRAFLLISNLSGRAASWMPGAIFSIFSVSVLLIVMLRVVGR